MEKNFAISLLNKVQEDYNLIADHFSSKRETLPDDFFELTSFVNKGEKILDLGCGNGRLYEVLKEKEVDYFGVDFSARLIEIAKKKYPDAFFQQANALSLPFADQFFDKVFSFAVLHHIPSEELRVLFLKEVKRVLKNRGIFVLSVWNLRKSKKLLIFWHNLLKVLGISKLDFGDVFYPWKDERGNVIVQRYIHCFSLKELKELFQKGGFKIKDIFEKGEGLKSNIYLISEK